MSDSHEEDYSSDSSFPSFERFLSKSKKDSESSVFQDFPSVSCASAEYVIISSSDEETENRHLPDTCISKQQSESQATIFDFSSSRPTCPLPTFGLNAQEFAQYLCAMSRKCAEMSTHLFTGIISSESSNVAQQQNRTFGMDAKDFAQYLSSFSTKCSQMSMEILAKIFSGEKCDVSEQFTRFSPQSRSESISSASRKRKISFDATTHSKTKSPQKEITKKSKTVQRLCHICMKSYTNVSWHHRKHHPEADIAEFQYDAKAKILGLGKYKNFKGFKCLKCRRVVQNLTSHYSNVHKEVDVKTASFQKTLDFSRIGFSSYESCLNQYKEQLCTMGVGKRNKTSETVAKTYCNQVKTLAPNATVFCHPTEVYANLQSKVNNEGADNTRHVYILTLLNFLRFYDTKGFTFIPENKAKELHLEAEDWQTRQRKIRRERCVLVKQRSRMKLDGIESAYKACLKYEKGIDCEKTAKLRKSKLGNLLKRNEMESLYADIFCRVTLRLGCRGSVFREMTVEELMNAEPMDDETFRILPLRQNDIEPASLVVSSTVLTDLKQTSKRSWEFLQKEATKPNDFAFPSLTGNGLEMQCAEFSKIFQKLTKTIFSESLTTTDVRKLIQTAVADELFFT